MLWAFLIILLVTIALLATPRKKKESAPADNYAQQRLADQERAEKLSRDLSIIEAPPEATMWRRPDQQSIVDQERAEQLAHDLAIIEADPEETISQMRVDNTQVQPDSRE
jgi:hypothetical protein